MKPEKDHFAQDPHKDIKWQLSSHARKRNWNEVIRLCKEHPDAQKASIRSGDTALHMAILDGQENAVRELVTNNIVSNETLNIQNKLGNTPLHLAAYLGYANMCRWIAERDPELIDKRNNDSETPIFRAVVHGRKEAFLTMHRLCKNEELYYTRCRKNDGSTILHSAISGEHFGLALEIIHLYPKFANGFDERGFSPLHLLAGKPSIFKSDQSRMGILQRLIYPFIHVKKLVDPSQSSQDGEDDSENYETSSGLIHQMRERIHRHRGRKVNIEDPNGGQKLDQQGQGRELFPKNYATCVRVLVLIFKAMGVLGLGRVLQIGKLREEKKKHLWSVQIMEKLLEQYSTFGYEYGENPDLSSGQHAGAADSGTLGKHHEEILAELEREGEKGEDNEKKKVIISKKTSGVTIQVDDDDEKIKKKLENMRNLKRETPLLIAAKHGTLDMVKGILKVAPVAIHDENSDEKNVVLLAAEYRQPDVYNFLCKGQDYLTKTIFYKTDKYGNSALHLTAKMSDTQSWNIPGPALQMQWEIKWYQFVEKSMRSDFFVRYNKYGETAWEIFCESHSDLVTEAGKWLTTTSQACSVVSVLIATVAFTTCTTVPGGPNQKGAPLLEKEAPFRVFAIGSLVALCFSIASVVMFMIFFTSRYNERDFATNLPLKFLVELTCLLISIAAVLISFCSAHFLVIRDSYKFTAFSLYAATLFPVGLYACWQIPRYVELLVATFRRKPHRIYE